MLMTDSKVYSDVLYQFDTNDSTKHSDMKDIEQKAMIFVPISYKPIEHYCDTYCTERERAYLRLFQALA